MLYEHEWILTKIIDIFLTNEEKEEYIIHAYTNLKRANLIQMLGLKMEFDDRDKLLSKVIIYINELINEEKQYLPSLIERIKTKRVNYCL